jgi:ribonuclease T2
MNRCLSFARALIATILALLTTPAPAQQQGQPGKFDFYLMNVAWGQEFCGIQGTSPQCKAPHAFVLHGLWTQNNDGTYPVFCSHEAGPANPAENLDITPDLALLQHEWDKHGTCAAVGPRRFFAMEHKAFHALKIPATYAHVDHEISLTPDRILLDFYKENPAFPRGSILLSCGHDHLTAVEACFSKNLKPIRCVGLDTCHASEVKIAPP